MRLAEDPVLGDAELLPRGELPLARVAGEAGEMVNLLLGLSHPVGGGDHATALERRKINFSTPEEKKIFKFFQDHQYSLPRLH